jgi:hypothetical protein
VKLDSRYKSNSFLQCTFYGTGCQFKSFHLHFQMVTTVVTSELFIFISVSFIFIFLLSRSYLHTTSEVVENKFYSMTRMIHVHENWVICMCLCVCAYNGLFTPNGKIWFIAQKVCWGWNHICGGEYSLLCTFKSFHHSLHFAYHGKTKNSFDFSSPRIYTFSF